MGNFRKEKEKPNRMKIKKDTTKIRRGSFHMAHPLNGSYLFRELYTTY